MCARLFASPHLCLLTAHDAAAVSCLSAHPSSVARVRWLADLHNRHAGMVYTNSNDNDNDNGAEELVVCGRFAKVPAHCKDTMYTMYCVLRSFAGQPRDEGAEELSFGQSTAHIPSADRSAVAAL
jgi:hypothetical protein